MPNQLLRNFPTEVFEAIARLKVSAKEDGLRSGALVMGRDYCSIAVEQQGDGFVLKQVVCRDADQGSGEEVLAQFPLRVCQNSRSAL